MEITIEAVKDAAGLDAAGHVRKEVFGTQCWRRLPRLDAYEPSEILTLLARSRRSHEPVAALSVVETTDDAALHHSLDLTFPLRSRVARYTQLAVSKRYRGLDVPAQLIHEARWRFVLPNDIRYTWLLFDADGARSSSLCRNLRFTCGDKEYVTEYGRSRVLMKTESADGAGAQRTPRLEAAAAQTWRHGSSTTLPLRPRMIAADEWLAQ